jgi:hypothetical protein
MNAPATLGVVFLVLGAASAAVALVLWLRHERQEGDPWPTTDTRTPADRRADARAAVDRALRRVDAGETPDPATAEERARLTGVFEMLSEAWGIPIPDRTRAALDHLTPAEFHDVIADTIGLARFESELRREPDTSA